MRKGFFKPEICETIDFSEGFGGLSMVFVDQLTDFKVKTYKMLHNDSESLNFMLKPQFLVQNFRFEFKAPNSNSLTIN